MNRRGPDYAEHLTDAERRILDTLLAEVGPRAVPASRRSWRSPFAVGVAALVILLAVTSVPLLHATAPPPSGAAGPATSTVAVLPPATSLCRTPTSTCTPGLVLSELAAAAAQAPVTRPRTEQWYRHRLDVRMLLDDDVPGRCRATAVSTQTWEEPQAGSTKPLAGRLVAYRTEVPDAAAALAGCLSAEGSPPSATIDETGVVSTAWYEMAEVLDARWLRYVDPRTIDADELFGGGLDDPAAWWTAFADVLADPRSDATSRAAALRAAAAREDAELVTGLLADLTGRWGVSLRVPYLSHGQAVGADLMFDAGTGALLQLTARTSTSVEATTYRAVGGR